MKRGLTSDYGEMYRILKHELDGSASKHGRDSSILEIQGKDINDLDFAEAPWIHAEHGSARQAATNSSHLPAEARTVAEAECLDSLG
jgi:hypothetical protein